MSCVYRVLFPLSRSLWLVLYALLLVLFALYVILYKCDILIFSSCVYTVGNNVNITEIEKSSLTLANDERLAQHRRIERSKNTLYSLTHTRTHSLYIVVVAAVFSSCLLKNVYFLCGFCVTIDRAFFFFVIHHQIKMNESNNNKKTYRIN